MELKQLKFCIECDVLLVADEGFEEQDVCGQISLHLFS